MEQFSQSVRKRWVGVVLAVSAVIAFALGVAGADDAERSMVEQFGEYGWLRCEVKRVRPPNDQSLIVQGEIVNPYDEPVDGIDLVVRLLARGGEERELDRQVIHLDTSIASRGHDDFRREVTTGYSKKAGNIVVVAFARQRAGKDMPPAPDEVVRNAGSAAAVNFALDVPYPSAPVSIDRAF